MRREWSYIRCTGERRGEKGDFELGREVFGETGGDAVISTFSVESMTTMGTKGRDDVDGERIERRGCANDAKNMRPCS